MFEKPDSEEYSGYMVGVCLVNQHSRLFCDGTIFIPREKSMKMRYRDRAAAITALDSAVGKIIR